MATNRGRRPRKQQEYVEESNPEVSQPVMCSKFERFNEEQETWCSYLVRLNNFFLLNGFTCETKKKQYLLNLLTPKYFHDLIINLSPTNPLDQSYNELCNTLETLIEPRGSIIAEQHKFSKRVQKPGESVVCFANDLKTLSTKCQFTCPKCNASTSDVHLRQQFISGLNDGKLLSKLIEIHEDKTFKQCLDLARSFEQIKEETLTIQKSNMASSCEDQFQVRGQRAVPRQGGNDNNIVCFRCGGNHYISKCELSADVTCWNCNKRGHISRICRRKKQNVHQTAETSRNTQVEEEDTNQSLMCMLAVGGKVSNTISKLSDDAYKAEMVNRPGKIMLECIVDDVNISFELDTGAAVSTISLHLFKRLFPGKKLNKTKLPLKTYTGEIIRPVGFATVEICYNDQISVGNLYVIPGKVDSIFGREWLKLIKVDLPVLNQVSTTPLDNEKNRFIKKVENDFPNVFQPGVGKVPNYEAHLHLKPNTKPVYLPPRPVPFALREKVDREIDRLEKEGIISRLSYSSWGTPVVPIVKPNGDIRLCADYKVSVNKVLEPDHYPIPTMDEIFSNISDCKYFSTIDISQAYLNIVMDEESAKVQAISTQKGVFAVHRLMFGTKNAPAEWQRFISQALEGITGVTVFYDDIRVVSKTFEEHKTILFEVFKRLSDNNLRVNIKKCQFFKAKIVYLGYEISEQGIHKCKDKVQAIVNAPRPTNKDRLRSWLGLVNYYGRFVKGLSSLLHPLYNLIGNGKKFVWTSECEKAWALTKKEILSDKVLLPYNPNLPLILSVDASPVGLGATLSHSLPDGSERPICFASRALSTAEKSYSQLDKEATAIFWGVNKFFQYLFSKRFVLRTDNKPLVSIFNPSKELPQMTAQRLLRYAIFLQGFDYEVEHVTSKDNVIADTLSRMPIPGKQEENFMEDIHRACLNQVKQISDVLPVNLEDIRTEIKNDPVLRVVYDCLLKGTPKPQFQEEYRRYSGELNLVDGCILRGQRVLVPPKLRKKVLEDLHSAHVGMVRMKALARSFVWWPRMDNSIEEFVKSCVPCQRNQKEPSRVWHPWEPEDAPWRRLHIDFLGPISNQHVLIVVDSFSKWLEAFPMSQISSKKTIENLEETFMRFGLPNTIVSDNATVFKSEDFERFLKYNGISHRTIAPYHPQSNGQAERYVQEIKRNLKKVVEEGGNLKQKLFRFIVSHRRAPTTVTQESPEELMFGRKLRSTLNLMVPLINNPQPDTNQKNSFRRGNEKDKKWREFAEGDTVLVRNYIQNGKKEWRKGKIKKRLGRFMYYIEVDGNMVWRRHVDQIRKL